MWVQAIEFGEAEVWMNERMMRISPGSVAEFITGYSGGEAQQANVRCLGRACPGQCTGVLAV